MISALHGACGFAGRADALVTGDTDILALAEAFSIPILRPAIFRRRLPDESRSGR